MHAPAEHVGGDRGAVCSARHAPLGRRPRRRSRAVAAVLAPPPRRVRGLRRGLAGNDAGPDGLARSLPGRVGRGGQQRQATRAYSAAERCRGVRSGRHRRPHAQVPARIRTKARGSGRKRRRFRARLREDGRDTAGGTRRGLRRGSRRPQARALALRPLASTGREGAGTHGTTHRHPTDEIDG